jgi:hypothetical protein
MQTVFINSTITKSQVKTTDDGWLVTGFPVTIDDEVMNGLTYSATHNAEGMPTIINKPITWNHPSKNGYPISVNDERRKWYIGGDIIKHYNVNGVNKVDIDISRSMLLANKVKTPDGETYGEYYANRLDSGLSIGGSTGLNLVPLDNGGGVVFATHQEYDHFSFLHHTIKPAGGNGTTAYFNADSGVMVINMDDELKSKRAREIEREEDKLDAEEDKLEDAQEASALKKLVKSLKGNALARAINALFGDSEKTGYNINGTTLNNSGEDEMSKNLIATLASMGVTVNADMSEEQVKAELLKINKGEKEAITLESLSGQLTAMNAEMQELKTKKKIEDDKAEADRLGGKKEGAAKEDEDADITKLKEEKKRKREKASNSLGFSVSVVNAMTDAELDRALGMQAGIHANASGGFNGDKKSESVFGTNYEWGA